MTLLADTHYFEVKKMPDLNDLSLDAAHPAAKSVEHSADMFHIAHEALASSIAGEAHNITKYGSCSLLRVGGKRQVHYLEATDPNGITLRVEVYFK